MAFQSLFFCSLSTHIHTHVHSYGEKPYECEIKIIKKVVATIINFVDAIIVDDVVDVGFINIQVFWNKNSLMPVVIDREAVKS